MRSSPSPAAPSRPPLRVRRCAAVATFAALALVGCPSSDEALASTAGRVDSTAVTDPTSPSTSPATTSPDTVAPASTVAAPLGVPVDALIVFQRGASVQTVLPDGSAPHVVTSATPEGQEHPDWSRDGRRIVFDTQFSKLWTVNADGSDPAAAYTCVSPCTSLQDGSWSPDGTEIAFMVAESQDGTTTSRSAIVALDVASGAVRTIYEDTSGLVWLFGPRWSGDGKSIVFEKDTYASNLLTDEAATSMAVAVVPSEGATTPHYLLTLSGPFEGPGSLAPDWSSTDDLIVFSRADNLFTIRADGTEETPVTTFDGVEEHAIQPTFTPDGSAIVFTYVTGQFGVNDQPTAAVIRLDGSGRVTVGGGATMTHPRVQP